MTIGNLLQLANHFGTFAFALSGVRLTENPEHRHKPLLTAFLSAFGGGLTRDLILLQRRPALFNSQIDILITLFVFLLYAVLRQFQLTQLLNNRLIKILLFFFDAAGTAVFICAGVEAAISCNAGISIILFSGVLTAIGGGIWAAFVAGRTPRTILRDAVGYRLIVLSYAGAYTFSHMYLFGNMEILDISLAAACVVCCYIRWRISENIVLTHREHLQKIRRSAPLKILFYGSQSQLFWSVVNPLRGVRTYRVYGSPRGKHMVIYSIIC